MLLRHTVSALALAATLGINSTPQYLAAATGPVAPPASQQLDEVGGGPGTTCLGCVAAGVVTVATFGWSGIYWLFMLGGATAVGAGATVAGCTAACAAYLAQE